MEGIIKQLVFSGSKGVTARVTVKEDYSIENNASSLTVFVDLACSRYSGHIYSLGGTLKVAGQTLWSTSSSSGSNDVYIQSLDTYYPVRYGGTATAATWVSSAIAHEQDGSKTIPISLEIYGYEASGKGSSGFNVSGNSNVTLTQIPRASAIGATDANIGSVSTISVSRKSTAYQHSIQYSFGSLSGYVTSTGGVSTSEQKFGETSIPFSVPTSFYSQIPNSKTGVCTLTCRTYSGSTQIGDATTGSFTVTASAETSSPVVSGTVLDSNEKTVAVTGNDSVMVRYMSNALCTITASARNNSSLVAKSINGTLINGNTLTVNGVSDPQIRFAAKDSRGYITDIPVRFNVIPYVLLTCVASVERTDPTSGNARLTIKGNYFSGSFGKTSNSLSINYTLNGTTVSLSPTISNNTYTASADLTGLDYQKQYSVSVSVVDKLSTVTKSVTVKKGIPVFDWGENDFAFHVPVNFDAGYGGTAVNLGTVPTDDALSAAIESVYSKMASNETKVVKWLGYPGSEFNFYGILARSSANYGSVSAHSAYRKGCLLLKTKVGGTWQALEWENPPMILGEEYRTTERWNGKAVYTKLFNYQTMPNKNTYAKSHEASATQIVRCVGMNTTTGENFPNSTISVSASKTSISITTTADHSKDTAYVQIWYTKD